MNNPTVNKVFLDAIEDAKKDIESKILYHENRVSKLNEKLDRLTEALAKFPKEGN